MPVLRSQYVYLYVSQGKQWAVSPAGVAVGSWLELVFCGGSCVSMHAYIGWNGANLDCLRLSPGHDHLLDTGDEASSIEH